MAEDTTQTLTNEDDIEESTKQAAESLVELSALEDSEDHPHKAKEKRFRRCSKLWFLTYPQIKDVITKEIYEEWLNSTFDNIKWYIIAEENHKTTEGRHLHVLFELEKRTEIKNCRKFDIMGCHCNIGAHKTEREIPARDKPQLVKYCTKDNNYIAKGIQPEKFLNARKNHKSTQSDEIFKKIKQGQTLEEINSEHGGFMILHLKQVQQYYFWYKEELMKQKKPEPFHVVAPKGKENHHETKQIVDWLNDNLFKNREHKQKLLS